MDLEAAPLSKAQKPIQTAPAPTPPRHRRRNCCLISLAVVLLLGILLLILGLTVFKAKRPVTTINSVTLERFSVGLDAPRMRVLLNLTADADVSVKNPNRVGMKYTSSTAYLNYQGQQVGESPIPAGKVGADDTIGMNISMTVMADRLLSNSKLFSDVLGGTVPMNVFTKISGKVNILGIKVHVSSSVSCDFTIFVRNTTVGDPVCKYKTKL